MASTGDADCTLGTEAKNDETMPEISMVEKKSTPKQLMSIISSVFAQLSKNAKKRWPILQEKVYQVDDPMQMKLYLNNFGQSLQQVGKLRDAIRLLEAAHAIETADPTADDVQSTIIQLLDEAYTITGPFRTEMNVMCLEMDLFGTKDSRTMSCESKYGNLIAKRNFNKGDVLFIDKPVVGYVRDSKIQCNYCSLQTLYTIPCVQCCAVHYCSVECQQNDNRYHKYECLGFQLQFSVLTTNVLALRMLVEALNILKQNLSQREPDDKPRTPRELWEVLLEHHTYSADYLQVFQGLTCNFLPADQERFHTLQQTVPQIMYYLQQEKQLLEDYKCCWTGLADDCCRLFLESILLRLLLLTKYRMCCFSYELAFDKADYEVMLSITNSPSCPKTKDYKRTLESYVMKQNHYYGMYRFQSEMETSRTDYNAICILLDHGAVAIRAVNDIKKGDLLTFMEGLPKKVVYFNPFGFPSCDKIRLIHRIRVWLMMIKSKAYIFTEQHFLELLLMFELFITLYHKVPKDPKRIIQLYITTILLEEIFHEARLIPLVLMQDGWMEKLIDRYIGFRVIKSQNINNFVDYMYNSYCLC